MDRTSIKVFVHLTLSERFTLYISRLTIHALRIHAFTISERTWYNISRTRD